MTDPPAPAMTYTTRDEIFDDVGCPTQDLLETLRAVLEDLRDEYLQPHRKPWIVGFSGGKDSTLMLHLVLQMLLDLPCSKRTRPVHVVCNDTLVESPLVDAFVKGVLAKLRDAVEALRVPVTVFVTTPAEGQSFWCNLIGRGYPAPSGSFRWCTDRMKIVPTGKYIRDLAEASGGAILLIGTRKAESATRKRSIEKHDRGGRLNPHGTVKGVMVYPPIVDLSTEQVWLTLLQQRPVWGGTFRALVTLYRNAQGGECPFVVDTADAPSCGSSGSSRFGCWTCTVVTKDRSMESMVANGAEHLGPLLDYRELLVELSARREARMTEGRTGRKVDFAGPFTFESRELLLARLLETQAQVGLDLISPEEIRWCRRQWDEDRANKVLRTTRVFLDILHEGRPPAPSGDQGGA